MAGKWHSSDLIYLEYVEKKKKSGSSNNWRKLNAWAFVRQLALHILCIYQEEADHLLLLNLLQWRFWLCRTWIQWQVVQNGRFTSCSGMRQSLPRSNLFLTWTRSPDTCHCFVCLIHCLLPDSADSITGSGSLSTSTNDFFYIVSVVYFLLLSCLCSSYIYI